MTPSLYPSESPSGKALFFASDLHAGIPSPQESRSREKHFITWLETHAAEAAAFYLLGDLWDFWFEYKRAVPKGQVRLLGALAALTDADIPIFFLPGNHDQWLTSYLCEEIGLRILSDPWVAEWRGQMFFLSHGHRLGPLPWTDRLANAIMSQPFLQRLYRWIHPDLGLWIGRYLSNRSRNAHSPLDDMDLGEKEYLRQFVRTHKPTADWYIFAHRHLPLFEPIQQSYLIVLGDWIRRYTYLRIDEDAVGLWRFSPLHEKVILREISYASVG
ncbi:MAG: UDP-2,3-diacylglucosamine diphosphatase [Bacteroidia bacterium]|nr:UDP-2,3-diacylglucosamine diphosphatase [Bacteroidia bacterium]MDW8235417.1 UDP-2,3-diacylglucosamine diphosphatase [Bacteroidia bacterium]